MQHPDPSFDIAGESALARLFETPKEASIVKELDHVDSNYAAWIGASPFVVLCSAGRAGLDASPRGDPAGFVEVLDSKTLLIPERRGNNRIDSLRNLMEDPRLALLPKRHQTRANLPTPGKILADATAGKIDGAVYDRELPGRIQSTLY
jgi:predicted pyridoxine 5'-phosphate oxidase superfamily flavin-nucleotide-binding protein